MDTLCTSFNIFKHTDDYLYNRKQKSTTYKIQVFILSFIKWSSLKKEKNIWSTFSVSLLCTLSSLFPLLPFCLLISVFHSVRFFSYFHSLPSSFFPLSSLGNGLIFFFLSIFSHPILPLSVRSFDRKSAYTFVLRYNTF